MNQSTHITMTRRTSNQAKQEKEIADLAERANADLHDVRMKALELLGRANDNATEAAKDAIELAKKANDNVIAGVALVLGSSVSPSSAAPSPVTLRAAPSAPKECCNEKSTIDDMIGANESGSEELVLCRKLADQHHEHLQKEKVAHAHTKGLLTKDKEDHKDLHDATEMYFLGQTDGNAVGRLLLRREREAHDHTKQLLKEEQEALQAEKEKVARLEAQMARLGQTKRDRDGGVTVDERPKKKSRVGE
ncbi:MAG: hypothetical protein SGARI_007047 [Bacillariaceae sp.]